MADNAKLVIGDKSYEFPIVTGSENESAIDIASLRAVTGGLTTIDPGFS